jgi:branched-subunit amino acid ABC-type transport system permease component
MSTFLQQLINGISLGAIYSLIALGYTMVYGVLKLINFAHGDVYMVGAFMGYYSPTASARAAHSTRYERRRTHRARLARRRHAGTVA